MNTMPHADTGMLPPSRHQMAQLREQGNRRRPATYLRAKQLLDAGPPTPAQADLLQDLGLPAAPTRAEASQRLARYEVDHPDWAEHRRRARTERGQATRRMRRPPAPQRGFDAQTVAFHGVAVARFPEGAERKAASLPTITRLRNLARQLPESDPDRLRVFAHLEAGAHQRSAGEWIGRLRKRMRIDPTAS